MDARIVAVVEGREKLHCVGHAEHRLVILPGSFYPLHHGHRAMARWAASRLGQPVAYELSVENVDKPPLSASEVAARIAQFEPGETVWVSRAPTFQEKSQLFPGCTFLLGADTARRLVDPAYLPASTDLAQLVALWERLRCHFLVFGRLVGQDFESGFSAYVPPIAHGLFTAVSEADFRMDISSTELRARGKGIDDKP